MNKWLLEKFGTSGAVLAALACPICFPKLAIIGGALGFGVLAPFEGYIAIGVQLLFILALIGQILAYWTHRNGWLLGLAIATTVTMFFAYYITPSSTLLEVALIGLVAASVWQIFERKRCAKCAPVSS